MKDRWRALLLIAQSLALLVSPWLLFLPLAQKRGIGVHSPSQYGPFIQALLTAGLLSSALSLLSFQIRETKMSSKWITGIGFVLSGFILYLLWGDRGVASSFKERLIKFDRELDRVAWIVLGIAVVAAFVSFSEWMSGPGNKSAWRLSFFCVDFPFMLGCILILIVKYSIYYEGTQAYINLLVEAFPHPSRGYQPDWFKRQGEIHSILQANFWVGFTAGAISVQLVALQVVSVATRIIESLVKDESSPSVMSSCN